MSECIYCAESFQDEQQLRFHLYRDHSREELGRIDTKRVEHSFDSFIQDDIATLEGYLQKEPTQKTIVEAIETFERVLRKTLEWEDLDQVHDRYMAGEPLLLDAPDTVVQSSGRDILLELIDTYVPRTESTVPPGVGAIIGNVVGRDIIRTRVKEGVEAIPAAELEYLEMLVEYDHPAESRVDRRFIDERWAVSHAYGWAIGHPTQDVARYIHATARDESGAEWSEVTLIQAFYADSDAAADVLARILADDQVPGRRFFVLSLTEVTRGVGIHTPQWKWKEEIDIEFELDTEVVERLRNLVEDSEFSTVVSEDWPYTAETKERT